MAFDPVLDFYQSPYGQRFFNTPANILAAAGFVLGATALALRARRRDAIPWLEHIVVRADRLGRNRRSTAISIAVIAIVTMVALSIEVNTGATIGFVPPTTLGPMHFWLEDLTGVLAGRSPLANFTPQYVNGLGYLTAPYFAIVGVSYGTFTGVVAVLSAIAFASVAFVFRAASGTWTRAAMLYVPYLSIATVTGSRYPDGAVENVTTYFALMPYRYFGPLVLLCTICLVMRRPSPLGWFIVGIVGGLVLANNLDFGLPAAVASIGACLVAGDGELRHSLRVVALESVGVLSGFVAFLIAMWAQSGTIPSLYQYVYFTLTYSAIGGVDTNLNYRTPFVAFHLIVWFTYAACVALPLFRSLARISRSQRQRLRDAAMMFVGIFGFGSGLYYVNREVNVVLIGLFVTWGIGATLLTCEVASGIARSIVEHRRLHWSMILPGALCASFLLLGVGSLSDGRGIERQWQLLTTPHPDTPLLVAGIVSGLKTCTPRGDRVIVDIADGYTYSTVAGVSNWMPYDNPSPVGNPNSIEHFMTVASSEKVSEIYIDTPISTAFLNTLESKGWIPTVPSVTFAADPLMTLWRQPHYLAALPSACR